ncbi:PQQ-dependent sugar dehydrogenase [Bathymodiolus japonicus methanotrophic gill symbiont]|uniref:PQQ-dependent sugar dehydrogenase n=1 Tax=Bathymodiolus japonicus methanotrophic gill symbiont TaxID=113269 RepID=UPI001C8E2979
MEIIARGIRNTVGFDWHPVTKTLYFTENGRDWLGDDIPPDELNKWTKKGQHFGYPYCHGGELLDPEFGKGKHCKDYTTPKWKVTTQRS